MDLIETVSVLAGSVILLGLFLSIAYEGIATRFLPILFMFFEG